MFRSVVYVPSSMEMVGGYAGYMPSGIDNHANVETLKENA